MSTKVLDLLLQLSVKGGADVQQLQKAVDSLKSTVTGFKGRSLDDILSGTNAKRDLDLIVDKSKTLFDLIAKGGKTPLNLNLDQVKSDLDLVLQRGRQFFDLLVVGGRQKLDLNLAQVGRDLDLVVAKSRQLFDLVLKDGHTKIDFNLTQIEKEAVRAQAAVANLRNKELKQLEQQQRASAQAATQHSESIAGLTREFLLFRRALFGLGIIGAVREVGQLIQAFDQARQALKAVFGEVDAKAQFEFIQREADRLGLSITGLAGEYAKFSAAARSLGLSQDLVKSNFLAVAEAGAKLGLSSQEVEGALTAIQQIASKGVLSMEELRQQLGDRLPGAISIAAKGLQVTEARLFALVSAGQITSEMFLKTFPAALRASFGTDINTRIETTTATLQRFKNSLSELIDAAVRAGALDAFLGIVKDLTTLFKDPATAKWLKDVSAGIADITRFVRENIDAVKTLLELYLGFRLFQSLSAGVATFGAALQKITGIASAGGVAKGVAGTAVAVKELSTAAADGAPKISNFTTALGSLALASKSPIVITVAGLAALDAALIEAFIAKLDRAKSKALELADAQRQVASQNNVQKALEAQTSALSDYAGAVALSTKEVNSLSNDGLKFYKDAATGAKTLADIQVRASQSRIDQINAELKVIQLSNDKSDEAVKKTVLYRDELLALAKAQGDAALKAAQFGAALDDVDRRAAAQGLTFDANIARLQALGKSFEMAHSSGDGLTKLNFDGLDKDAQRLVESFKRVLETEQSVAKAFTTIIPKNFADAGQKAIADLGNALAFLQQEGIVTAKVIGDELAGALDKLAGNDLNKFQIQAQAAFEAGKLAAQGLALVLDGVLKASLKNMGLDAETAGQKISKAFGELINNFNAIAQNARATGAQIKGALDVAIQSAKTKEELAALQATIEGLGLASGKFGAQLEDSLLRLQDKIRITGGIIDSALGDSFDRLGVKSKIALKALADQAEVDFNRIKVSGQATALELEAAFRQFADKATALNNGIPPISIRLQAVDFNAFDLIVKSAEVAGERVKKAIEDAIPLADTKAKLVALSEAITQSFEKGKLSVDDFGKLITEVGFKLRDMAAKPVGELAASADLLQVKTKDQLKATADNFKQAFGDIAASGQFTNEELAKGATQFLEAYKAANNGVVDSFDPVVAKAQEVLDSINQNTAALDTLKSKALEPIAQGNLKDLNTSQLQQMLADTIKTYREIGLANIGQLQIVQQLQKEIADRGRQQADDTANRMKDAANAMKDGANSLTNAALGSQNPAAAAPGGALPGGGQFVNTFNFNGGNLTADEVKRKIIPVFATIQTRRR